MCRIAARPWSTTTCSGSASTSSSATYRGRFYLDGKLKVLAVLDKARNAAMPDVPTSAEVALPGLLSGVWYAMVGPPKLKPELRDQIAKATIEVLKMPDVQQRFRKLNVEPDGGTPAETAAFIKNEVRRWGEVIRANHIMAE
jgi:tripartite-type tricarboxylate transporter receptor subunit TctC